jgi:hypothetical protein
MLLNGAARIEETATQFSLYALLHSVTCAQLRLITILGNCGCVAVASFLVVSSAIQFYNAERGHSRGDKGKGNNHILVFYQRAI